jgi:hypothetical protein
MSETPPTGNGWNEWKNLVLAELKRGSEAHEKLGSKVESIEEKISELSSQIAILKIKASAWGVIGGIGAAVGYMLIERLVK